VTAPTTEQLDNLLDRAERHALSTTEAQALTAAVRRLVERGDQAEAAVQRVRDLAADMRTWCSPHGVAVDYAQRIEAALDALPEPADTDPARPITQHWTQETPRA